MSFGYVVRPRADRDINEITAYLDDEAGLETALRFLAEIHATFELIAAQRDIGWPCKLRHPSLLTARTLPVSSRFEKYLIFYQPFTGRVDILRVVHGAQDLDRLFTKEGVE